MLTKDNLNNLNYLKIIVDINDTTLSIKDISLKWSLLPFQIKNIAKKYPTCITNVREYKDNRLSDELTYTQQYAIYRDYRTLIDSKIPYAIGKIAEKYRISYRRLYPIFKEFDAKIAEHNRITEEDKQYKERMKLGTPNEQDIIRSFKHPIKGGSINMSTNSILEQSKTNKDLWKQIYCVVNLQEIYDEFPFVKKYMLDELKNIYYDNHDIPENCVKLNIQKIDGWIYAILEAKKDTTDFKY